MLEERSRTLENRIARRSFGGVGRRRKVKVTPLCSLKFGLAYVWNAA
jgi:hypothetical protein